ncbi:hypothetical protein GLAREA_07359 [Glarea lozoyensis ATCC 20868]|uniref:2EXR domain-containing protein n=1 Tax=Glarea lozoyensis (strain ATCC 20868 / MF5171) TaxID=1116229 RepID=S3DJL5_GLAL2|nr:uncharacterized protein GLAREA_07359 [Glarea lozoyensis ATCC 20868]EPE32226.1 hypothetical protein GLAREA_07359 [Glarea lozoyensis ATCC 20868]
MDTITQRPQVCSEFHKFRKLPVELRFEIWELALRGLTRNIEFNWHHSMCESPFGVLDRHLPPPLLSTCHESRVLALKYYEKWTVGADAFECPQSRSHYEKSDDASEKVSKDDMSPENQPDCSCFHPYVNFDSDTFVLEAPEVEIAGETWSTEFDKVKHVEIREWEHEDIPLYLEEWFAGLKRST